MSCNEDTQIKGPYSLSDWKTMLILKEGIEYMKQNAKKFGRLLEEDKKRQKNYYSKGNT